MFENKLHIILELFDKSFSADAMDDVAIQRTSPKSVRYSFVDTSHDVQYDVIITPTTLCHFNNDMGAMFNYISQLQLPGVITNDTYAIALRSDQELHGGFGLTGLGNANFVYGKMLACFFDFIDKRGVPAAIRFTAYDSSTSLVYAKLLKFIERSKGLKYQLVDYGVYVLDQVLADVLEKIDEQHYNRVIKYINDEQGNNTNVLATVRQAKANKRKEQQHWDTHDVF